MRHNRLKSGVLLLFGLWLTGLQAQHLYVRQTSGSQIAYSLSEIKKMSFSSGSIVIAKIDRKSDTSSLSNIRYLNFQDNLYTISANVLPVNSGTIAGAGSYDHGSTVSLTATPSAGYTFVNWTENGTSVSTDSTYSFTATSGRSLVANFQGLPSSVESEDRQDGVIQLYPNPVSDFLNVKFSGAENQQYLIEVFTIEGKVVYQEKLFLINNAIELNVANLPQGLYLCKIFNGSIIKTTRFVKQ